MILDSKYFTIFGLQIHFYGLIMGIAIITAVAIICAICKKRGFKTDDIWLVALYAIPIGIVGARIYYCVFSSTSYSFIDFFKVWEGGLAVYGSIIGGGIGVVLYCIIHKKDFLKLADILVIGVAIGQCIGRIGCYFGGCCYGVEVTNPALQWFPLSVLIGGTWHYSTFFYESFCALILFVVLLILLKKIKTKGVVFSSYLIGYGIIRVIIEGFRGDSLYIANTSIRVSQVLSGAIVIAGIALLLVLVFKGKKDKSFKFEETNSANEK